MLDGVGLSKEAERVYRTLLRYPTSTSAQLASRAGISEAELAGLIGQLVRVGLVGDAADTGDPMASALVRWTPLDPRIAVGALVRERQASIDAALRGAEELAIEFAEGMLRSHRSQLVDVVDGERQVLAALLEMTASATTDVAVLDAPPYLDIIASGTAEHSLMARGVRSRAVYAATALEEPDRYKGILLMVAAGEQAKVLPAVPLKLVVVDGEQALLPLSIRDGKIDSVIVVRPSMLASALFALFEALWVQAMPLPVDTVTPLPGGLDEIDRAIIVLLATGMKDEAIARQVGISSRTLGRRTTRLLAQLGASSRFQAGIQAHRHSWI